MNNHTAKVNISNIYILNNCIVMFEMELWSFNNRGTNCYYEKYKTFSFNYDMENIIINEFVDLSVKKIQDNIILLAELYYDDAKPKPPATRLVYE